MHAPFHMHGAKSAFGADDLGIKRQTKTRPVYSRLYKLVGTPPSHPLTKGDILGLRI
jgi:hypothetical protein